MLIGYIPSQKDTSYTKQLFANIYITDLVCYTNFQWVLNHECQHIFGKQTGYIFQSPKKDNDIVDKNRNNYASLNQ